MSWNDWHKRATSGTSSSRVTTTTSAMLGELVLAQSLPYKTVEENIDMVLSH